MRWFDFSQNNSGGFFVQDESVGINVFIEAESAAWANQKALTVGVYFNGCSTGRDCSCCGDRWYQVWDSDDEEDQMDEPSIFDYASRSMIPIPREVGQAIPSGSMFRKTGAVHIYHADGAHEAIYFENNVVTKVTKE